MYTTHFLCMACVWVFSPKKERRRKVSFDEIKTFCYYQLLSNVSLSSARWAMRPYNSASYPFFFFRPLFVMGDSNRDRAAENFLYSTLDGGKNKNWFSPRWGKRISKANVLWISESIVTHAEQFIKTYLSITLK